jgi:hypothetical protein
VPSIEGIAFDEESYKLVQRLIVEVKSLGDCAVYGLPRMHKPRGELRMAHFGPDLQHVDARKVFALIKPTKAGAVVRRPGKLADGQSHTVLTSANFEQLLVEITSWRSQRSEGRKMRGISY